VQGLCAPCTGALRVGLKHGQQPPLHAVTACFKMPHLKSLWCFVHCSAQEVKERFGKYGMVRDVYLPLDHYTRHAACAFTMPCRELSSRQACSCASLKHAWCKRHRQVPCFPPGRALGTSKNLHNSGPARVTTGRELGASSSCPVLHRARPQAAASRAPGPGARRLRHAKAPQARGPSALLGSRSRHRPRPCPS